MSKQVKEGQIWLLHGNKDDRFRVDGVNTEYNTVDIHQIRTGKTYRDVGMHAFTFDFELESKYQQQKEKLNV